jgi:hypothetical protein
LIDTEELIVGLADNLTGSLSIHIYGSNRAPHSRHDR